MSVKQSFSSSSYSTSSSGASLCTNPMKSSSSSDSTSCQSLLQSSRDIGRKMAAARCPSKESDSSGRSFLSVRKNDTLMNSRDNMVERSITQGLKLRLLLSGILKGHYITPKFAFPCSWCLHAKKESIYGRTKIFFTRALFRSYVLSCLYFLRDTRWTFI